MKKDKKDILSTIYNEYTSTDWEYGNDNLLPKREISLSAQIEKLEEAVLATAKSIKANAVKKVEPVKKSSFNIGNSNISRSTLYSLNSSLGDDIDSELAELEYTYNIPSVYGLSCVSSNDSSSTTTTYNEAESTITELEASKEDYSFDECELFKLEILKYILAVVKVIKIISKLVSLVYSVSTQISELVSMAAQVWNNPTWLSTIASVILESVVSILTNIIGGVLAFLWGLIKTDCITQQTQQTISDIMGVLSGITELSCESYSLAMKFTSKDKDEFLKAWEKTGTAFGIGGKSSFNSWDETKDKYSEDWKKAGSIFTDYGTKGTWQKDLKSIATSSEAYASIMSVVNQFTKASETVKEDIGNFVKIGSLFSKKDDKKTDNTKTNNTETDDTKTKNKEDINAKVGSEPNPSESNTSESS